MVMMCDRHADAVRDFNKTFLSKVVDKSIENRCPKCNKLLFFGEIGPGTAISIECKRCNCIAPFGRQV